MQKKYYKNYIFLAGQHSFIYQLVPQKNDDITQGMLNTLQSCTMLNILTCIKKIQQYIHTEEDTRRTHPRPREHYKEACNYINSYFNLNLQKLCHPEQYTVSLQRLLSAYLYPAITIFYQNKLTFEPVPEMALHEKIKQHHCYPILCKLIQDSFTSEQIKQLKTLLLVRTASKKNPHPVNIGSLPKPVFFKVLSHTEKIIKNTEKQDTQTPEQYANKCIIL